VRADPVVGHQHRLDLGGEHVDPTHHHHVVPAAEQLAHPAEGARRAGHRAGQPGHVAGAVAQQRHAGLGERGEHQLSRGPLRHRVALGVHRLHEEVVLGDVEHAVGVQRLAGHPWPDDLGQAVDVQRAQPEQGLDRAAHLVGPRLGAEQPGTQRQRVPTDPLRTQCLTQVDGEGRGAAEQVRSQVEEQLHLPVGHPAGDRDHRRAQPDGPVVHTDTTGEQPIAVGALHRAAPGGARPAERPRHHLRPHVDVVRGVRDERRPATRSRGPVHADDLILGHGA